MAEDKKEKKESKGKLDTIPAAILAKYTNVGWSEERIRRHMKRQGIDFE